MDKNELNLPGMDTNNNQDRDKKLKDTLGAETGSNDLVFNDDSYEIDVESEDPDYNHPDPYTTGVKNGSDFDSDYDEANVYSNDEYNRVNDGGDEGIEEYGMRIDQGKIVELDKVDEILAQTEEDKRTDLDEEGYPLKDAGENDLFK